ncbi:KTSC domain-containing protein [Methanococcoides alaskense]|uniref:KTSC domain-containing protein n=1 Tax=Methanococcoides alaskense TaxID=325778 RepID=UPI0034DD7EF2
MSFFTMEEIFLERKSVKSSKVKSIGYDEDTCILEVEFNNSSIYHYHGVPLKLYNRLMNDSSKGRFMKNKIRYKYKNSCIKK